jgi:hypothetical protein
MVPEPAKESRKKRRIFTEALKHSHFHAARERPRSLAPRSDPMKRSHFMGHA